jgi:hypothetical protein
MPMNDLKNNISALVAFNFQEITSDTTTPGNIIDMQGYQALTFIFQAGTITDGTYTPKVEHGENSGLSDAAEVADSQLIGTEAAALLDASNEITKLGYVGYKRYVRASIVSASTSSGGFVGAVAIRSSARHKKVS